MPNEVFDAGAGLTWPSSAAEGVLWTGVATVQRLHSKLLPLLMTPHGMSLNAAHQPRLGAAALQPSKMTSAHSAQATGAGAMYARPLALHAYHSMLISEAL